MKKLYSIIILFMLLHDQFCIQGSDTSTSSIESNTDEPSPKPKPKPRPKRVTFKDDVVEINNQHRSTRRATSSSRQSLRQEEINAFENALHFFKLKLHNFLKFLNQERLDLMLENFLSNGKKSYLVLLDILENPYNHEYNDDVKNSEDLFNLQYEDVTRDNLEAAWERYQNFVQIYYEILRNELRDKNRIFDAFATLGINSADFISLYQDKNDSNHIRAAQYIQNAFDRMARKSQETDEFGNIKTENDFEEILEAYEFLKTIYPIDNVKLQEAYVIVGLANTATLDEAIRHKNAMLKSLSSDMHKTYLDAYDIILKHLKTRKRL